MRGLRQFLVVLAAAAVSAAQTWPVQAQSAPVTDWELTQTSESCSLARGFAGDYRLVFQAFGPETPYHVILTGEGLPLRDDRSELVRIGFGGEAEATESLGFIGKAGKSPMLEVLARFRGPGHVMAWLFSRAQVQLGAPFDPAAETLFIDTVEMEPVTLAIGPMEEEYARLDDCVETLAEKWRASASGARFAAIEAALLRPVETNRQTKYPQNLLLNRISGLAEIRMTIDEAGRARDCVVQSTNWDRRFGESACADIEAKARFEPARDSSGQPTRALYRTAAVFAIYKW